MPTVVCPACGVESAMSEEHRLEVGSWVFLNCPTCRRQSDVTFVLGAALAGDRG